MVKNVDGCYEMVRDDEGDGNGCQEDGRWSKTLSALYFNVHITQYLNYWTFFETFFKIKSKGWKSSKKKVEYFYYWVTVLERKLVNFGKI